MPTQALAAYGTQLRLSNGISPGNVAITGATGTAPIQITTGSPHGIPVGEVSWVNIVGALGMTSLNGSWVAQGLTATTLRLRNSFPNSPWTSGGIVTVRGTFTHVAELVNLTPIGMSFAMVDASSHDGSGWGTSIPTLKRGVDMRIEINLVPAHATHNDVTGLVFLAINKIRRDWLVVLPDAGKSTIAFDAWVTDHSTVTPIAGVLRSTPVLTIDEAMVFALV